MIAESFVFVYGCVCRSAGDAGSSDLVVDAPAYVFCPGLTAVAPPCVAFPGRFRVQASIDVHPLQLIEYTGQPLAFLRKEAAIFHIALPVLQVDFLVGDVPVAANDDLPATTRQLFQVGKNRSMNTYFAAWR